MSSVLGSLACPCGGSFSIVEGKGGTLNGRCPCGAQVFQKSPAGVRKWLEKFSGDPLKPSQAVKPDKKPDQLKKSAPAAAAGGLLL